MIWCLLFSILGVVFSSADSRAEDLTYGSASIQYVAGNGYYLDAGREQGLQLDDIVEIVRGGVVVARLRVSYLASARASCQFVSGEVEPAVGDVVRFVPHVVEKADSRPTPTEPMTLDRPAQPTGRHGVRGRVGVRHMMRSSRNGGDDLSRPALDLRLEGREILGSRWDGLVDVRARRSTTKAPDGSSIHDSRAVVYQARAAWSDGEHLRLLLGRQYSQRIPNLGIYDGAAISFSTERWELGAISGVQPSAVDLSPRFDVLEHGFYAQVHQAPQATSRWAVLTGVVGSYDGGEINREYVVIDASLHHGAFFAGTTQEVDFNRGWRSELESSGSTPTSSLLRARYRFSRGVSLGAGYDSRRSVRLFRDRETPETGFDDAVRRGAWGDLSFPVGGFTVATRVQARRASGNSDSYSVRVSSPPSRHLRFWERSARYRNELSRGWLHSGGVWLRMGSRAGVEVGTGLRREQPEAPGLQSESESWSNFDLDIALSQAWVLLFSYERSTGDGASDVMLSSLIVRF